MGKRRVVIGISMVAAMCFALATVVGCGGSAPSADSPAGTVKALFAAMAKGDVDGMKKLVTGKAAAKMPKKGSKDFDKIKKFGAALKDVRDVKIKGDNATAVAVVDMKKVVSEKEIKKLQALVSLIKSMAAKTKDPAKKKAMLAKLKEFEKGEISLPIMLAKKGGKWVIVDMKK